jgi:hypothetical protein
MAGALSWDVGTYRELAAACYGAPNAAERGRTLEDFLEYTFSAFPGIQVLARDARMGSQELDLVLWNDRCCDYFDAAGSELIVEAKNWDTAVGSAEVAWFLEKMRQRRVTHGFFVTRSGVTGECRDGRDGALDTLFGSLREGLRPVVITLDEMMSIANHSDLTQLFKLKVARLLVRRL